MSQMHNRDREGLRTHPSQYHCNSNDQLGIREPTEVKHVFSRLNISCFMRKCLNNSCDKKANHIRPDIRHSFYDSRHSICD